MATGVVGDFVCMHNQQCQQSKHKQHQRYAEGGRSACRFVPLMTPVIGFGFHFSSKKQVFKDRWLLEICQRESASAFSEMM
jgi:hypothetical protein